MSPLPGQASFSTATTAVASNGTTYPSVEEFTSFKLPPQPEILEPKPEDVSALSDEFEQERKLDPRPATPTPPSPVSTESSDREISDDTPTNVRGESMIYPKHPLAAKKLSTTVPATPRWPFQDATPRASAMAPIAHSHTQSSVMGSRNSPPGEVSISESLDEFQLNHPNARLLALHPPGLAYYNTNTTRNLANVPEFVEKPFRPAQHETTVPMVYKERHINPLHSRRWSGHLLKFNLHRRHEGRNSVANPKTFWWQRIATQQDMFIGSTFVTFFCLCNTLVSVTSIVTLTVARVPIPAFVIVWIIVSISTTVFTGIIFILMHRFRTAVASDEENRGRPTRPRVYGQREMRLPASPREVANRRRLSAAPEQDSRDQQNIQKSLNNEAAAAKVQVPELGAHGQVEQPMRPDNFAATEGDIMATIPRQNTEGQIENYWTDISLVPTSRSESSSITAVITSAVPAPTNTPRSAR